MWIFAKVLEISFQNIDVSNKFLRLWILKKATQLIFEVLVGGMKMVFKMVFFIPTIKTSSWVY
jgi:hypothetical protein